MEITVGIQNTARELALEVAESAAEVSKAVSAAIESGRSLTLTDVKGRTVIVPAAALAFVELGSEEQRPVGFGAL
ncbi:DUF3107 domain-containing protein [Rarobacter faecitabidus]|uniref:Uncharacterized protein DUF3107 n=1 Tax=Rarobacter faecitabidus TaxID=13243 RepID=A0A542ZXP7_RARFA|nr:DUF3107 domain-containing protein [Rarobacter faecitabidus]TQL64976.1 uncharacterized protein DUF3107 [Rarobacter faecitabidus]